MTRFTCSWCKNEKKYPQDLLFVFEPLRFQHICPSFLLSKFTILQLLVSAFQGNSSRSHQCSMSLRVPGLQVPSPRVPSLGSQITGARSHDLMLDYVLLKTHFWKKLQREGEMQIHPNNLLRKGLKWIARLYFFLQKFYQVLFYL